MKQNTKNWLKNVKRIWVAMGIVFTLWLVYSMQAKNLPDGLFESNALITFEEHKEYFRYTPTHQFDEVLIFFPGALVDTRAYLPLSKQLAEKNISVYLIKMPLRQARLGYHKPISLNLLSDESKTYTLVGHSQGAKMAAQLVYENPALFDRLVLIGTTHPRDISIANSSIPIMKIYGSRDGVADENTIMANKSKLPSHTQFLKIEGANHAQFAYYGFQLGDSAADIDRETQQSITLTNILSFISEN
ncbi:alpha/beta hydrolase [Agaribacter flavus]|uniref:Alpha/beta hydrolase n=1 Tax=Agaribacter flavus TaxID=1902781 RepID=A0ABV7FSK9_9ALTE